MYISAIDFGSYEKIIKLNQESHLHDKIAAASYEIFGITFPDGLGRLAVLLGKVGRIRRVGKHVHAAVGLVVTQIRLGVDLLMATLFNLEHFV